MADYNWKSGVSGDWGSTGDWVQDAVPNSPTANATISSSSAIDVTIAAGETVTADSVTLDSVGVTLDVKGLLNLGGSKDQILVDFGTLDVASTGTIANGTIVAGGGEVFLSNDATLDDITYQGDLDITGGSHTLTIEGGLHVVNAGGIGPGTFNVTGKSEVLDFLGNQSLDNVVLTLGNAKATGNIEELDVGNSDTLTLGTDTTVNSIFNNAFYGGDIINEGTINVTGAQLFIDCNSFSNEGVIKLAPQARLDIEEQFSDSGLIEGTGAGTSFVYFPTGTLFTDLSGTKLTGGEFEANPGNTMALVLVGVSNMNVTLKNDGGLLVLNGAGSEITTDYIPLESTLQTIGSGGTLKVIGDRGYTTSNTLDVNGGKLVLGGGTFSAALLDLAGPASHFIGYGTLEGPIENAGAINANAGTLIIDGPLSGAGALVIDAASTLELTSGTSENVTFTGAGSQLVLDSPAAFTGTLSHLAAGDRIDLAGDLASHASLSGTSLLVTLTNHTVLDYTLATSLPLDGVSISSDGGAGSELTFYQLPEAPAMQFIRPNEGKTETASSPGHAGLFEPLELRPDQGAFSFAPRAVYSHASITNPQGLWVSLNHIPSLANVGIVLPTQ